jgi:tetratricopeptide (TPR) repeat protein
LAAALSLPFFLPHFLCNLQKVFTEFPLRLQYPYIRKVYIPVCNDRDFMAPTGTLHLSEIARRNVRKLLARSCLQEGRIEAAIEAYHTIHLDDAQDIFPYLMLAVLYQLAGSPPTAQRLCQEAAALAPNEPPARVLDGLPAHPVPDWLEGDPFQADALSRLAQRLRASGGGQPGALTDIMDAASACISRGVSKSLNPFMPALVAWSMRQTRAAGREDLTQALKEWRRSMDRMPGEPDEAGAGSA